MMRLVPKSDDEPDVICTLDTRVMRCGHRQTYSVGQKVSLEEWGPVDGWPADYRARFEEGLAWELDRYPQNHDCEACERDRAD